MPEKNLSSLFKTVQEGNTDLALILLQQGADPNEKDQDNMTPLHLAVTMDDLEMVKLLVQNGADINAPGPKEVTPFCLALFTGKQEIMQALKEYGAELTVPPWLLEAHPDLAEYFETKQSPRIKVEALTSDPKINKIIKSNPVAWHRIHLLAVQARQSDAVSLLLAIRNELVGIHDKRRVLYPMVAAMNGDVPTMEVYLKAGFNINTQDENGNTALMVAAQNDKTLMVSRLLAQNADPNLRRRQGHNALHDAAERGNAILVQILVDAGVDVNSADNAGNRALHFAAYNGRKECVELLLRLNSDPAARNKDGMTALHAAAAGKHNEICRIILGGKDEIQEFDPDDAPDDSWLVKEKYDGSGLTLADIDQKDFMAMVMKEIEKL